jgi:hypothetical protein
MHEAPGYLVTVALVCVFGVTGLILTFNPRMIRSLIARLYNNAGGDEGLSMPGALISMRFIGAGCLALAGIVVAAGQGFLSLIPG